MLDISLFEKIKTVFNLILTAPYFILLLVFAIIVYYLLFQSTKTTKNQKNFIYASLYGLILLAVIIKYNKEIISLLDYLIDNIFIIFYFPNLAAYAVMIIIINVILLSSIFSKKMSITVRKLNIAAYCLMTYLLFIVMDLISKNNLDIYLNTTLYANKEVMSVIQISNIIFIVWLIAIVIYKLASNLDMIATEAPAKETYKRPVAVRKEAKNFIPRFETKLPEKFTVKEAKPRIVYQTRIEKEPDLFTKEEYITVLNLLKNLQNNK